MTTVLEGGSKVMLSLWICPVLESIIPNQMNCKIHLILLLTGTLKVHCFHVYLLSPHSSSEPCLSALFQSDAELPVFQNTPFIPYSCHSCKLPWEFLWRNMFPVWKFAGELQQTMKYSLKYNPVKRNASHPPPRSAQIYQVYPWHIFATDNRVLEN